jgi:hypothetical protein
MYEDPRPAIGSPADRGRRACPVSVPVQAWLESSFQWFTEQFGSGALRKDAILPSAFVPARYAATREQLEVLVRRVAVLMGVSSGRVTVEAFDGTADRKAAARSGRSRAVGHYREVNGRAVVALDLAEAGDPASMTAIIAHELSHVLLIGDRRISPERPDQERLTDLLTVYFGFGIFTANAALRYSTAHRGWVVKAGERLDERMLNAARNDGYSRLGYLTEREFGYALACYCQVRGETRPRWVSEIDPGPRSFLEQGLAYLSGFGENVLPVQRLLATTFTHGASRIRVVLRPAYQDPVNKILAAVDEAGRPPRPTGSPLGQGSATQRAEPGL